MYGLRALLIIKYPSNRLGSLEAQPRHNEMIEVDQFMCALLNL